MCTEIFFLIAILIRALKWSRGLLYLHSAFQRRGSPVCGTAGFF